MKKLFTGDKFFSVVTWIALIGMVVADAMYVISSIDFLNTAIKDILCVICLFFTYTSYRKHSKNVMKGLMGALLMAILIQFVSWTVGAPEPDVFRIVLNYVSTLLAVLLFVNHFIINSDHHSSPKRIQFNQIIVFLFMLLEVVKNIIYVPIEPNVAFMVADIIWAIAFACLMASIVCIESRLDAYRQDREAAGWTEEKGYPNGYVHEYEKNK